MAAGAKTTAASNEPPRPVSYPPVILRLLLLSLALVAVSARAETLAEKTLREIVERQKALFAKAEKDGDDVDTARFQGEAQAIASSYDVYIQNNPTNAAGFAAYGIFLDKVGMSKQAAAILLRANKLDGENPIVKNQIAKLLAEDGKPVEALPWLTAAIDLAPREPFYHYHMGLLLREGREFFLKQGGFTRAGLDKSMLEAFAKAAELAPGNWEFALQHAKAYYDLETPKWAEALGVWQQLENRPTTTGLRQLIQLHEAKVLLNLGRAGEARGLLDRITEPQLALEKQTLLDEVAKAGAK